MARVKPSLQQIHELEDAQIRCRAWGHSWDDDPAADWHTPQFEWLHSVRLYFRCTRGCGCVKVAVYQMNGKFISGFTRYPDKYRVTGVGRGAGRRPFIAEYIDRRNVTPTGRKRNRGKDKARRLRAVGA